MPRSSARQLTNTHTISTPTPSRWSLMTTLAVLLLLWAPAVVKTTAFSSGSNLLASTSSGSTCSIDGLRGGAQRHTALTDQQQRRQKWRMYSTEAVQVLPGILSNSTAVTRQPQEEETVVAVVVPEQANNQALLLEDRPSFFRRIDGVVFLAYLCNVMALSLPVLLVPIAATEHAATTVGVKGGVVVAAHVASISSIASLGGAMGKFVNGFICKEFGSYQCSKYYLAGLGVCSLAFSASPVSPRAMGLAFGGMEFFASIQWASLAVMLSNYYASQPVKLAAALTALGLSSTGGQIMAKVFGMTLSHAFHWRQVAQLGALVAFVGAALISRAPGRQVAALQQRTKPKFQLKSVGDSLKAVLGSRLFLVLGLAHAMAFVTRGTDRILGTFFHEMAGLPLGVCGGMTLSITLGLVHGLITGAKKFGHCADLQQKRSFLKKRYISSVAATFGLAILSQIGAAGLIPNRFIMTGLVALMSGVMASNIAFQYFQFPAMIAQRFGDHKAVVISFLDGFGFLSCAPIFATMSRVVPSLGWSAGWTVLGTLFGSAAFLMLSSINPILNLAKTPAEEAALEAKAEASSSAS